MPGIRGKKLPPRRSKTGKYSSIRQLVFALLDQNQMIEEDAVNKIVMREYPKSNFAGKDGKLGHFAWYKHTYAKLKLEEANFKLKEPKKSNAKTKTHASETDQIGRLGNVDADGMGKKMARTKDRRSQTCQRKHDMAIKTGKTTQPYQASDVENRQDPEVEIITG